MRLIWSPSWNRWNLLDAPPDVMVREVPAEGDGEPYKSDAAIRFQEYLKTKRPTLVFQQISPDEYVSNLKLEE